MISNAAETPRTCATSCDPPRERAVSPSLAKDDPTAIPRPEVIAPCDPVEQALATGLAEAARAARWDVVTALSRELEARRLARVDSNVVPLRTSKRADGK